MRTALTALMIAAAALMGCEEKRTPMPEPLPSASASAKPAEESGPKVHEHVVLSKVYEVDEVWKSMQGPASMNQVTLTESKERELLWIVGFEAVMMNASGEEQVSQEFMCHTNLDLDIEKHQARFNDDKSLTGRLFTLSQGQHRIDFPKGFGLPIISDELLDVNTQVLNLNMPDGKREVRHKVTMRFVRDKDLEEPMKALFVSGAFGLKVLDGEDGHYGLPSGEDPAKDVEHTACLPGANAGNSSFDDGDGRTFTGHWVVPPGREVNHTRVTELMALPFDTTVHYVAVHLHPFAETLELRDLRTGKQIYKAKTRQADVGIGLAWVDRYASVEGFPVYEDHEYEIVSVYNNTSSEPQDSMAVLNLYMLDKDFTKPDLSKPPPSPKDTPEAAPSASVRPATM